MSEAIFDEPLREVSEKNEKLLAFLRGHLSEDKKYVVLSRAEIVEIELQLAEMGYLVAQTQRDANTVIDVVRHINEQRNPSG